MEVFKPHPQEWFEIRRYRMNISRSKHRIVIEGMRGKSGLTETLYWLLYKRGVRVLGKVTGLEPKIFYEGRIIPIDRGALGKFFLDEENVGVVAWFPADVYVVENQAITRLTMRHVHRIYRPDIVVVPNIRFEHMEGLGDNFEEIAEAFALGFKGVEHVVYAESTGESDRVVRSVFERFSEKYNFKLHVIRIPPGEMPLPAVERVYVAETVFRLIGMKLLPEEKREILESIREGLKPSWSPLGFEWYDASKVNDPESTDLVLKYILERTRKPLYILAFFRKDRIDRTVAFLEFFRDILVNDRVRGVWVAGSYYRLILKRLGSKGSPVKSYDGLREIFEEVRRENGLLFLAVNGVTPFMDRVREVLTTGRF